LSAKGSRTLWRPARATKEDFLADAGFAAGLAKRSAALRGGLAARERDDFTVFGIGADARN